MANFKCICGSIRFIYSCKATQFYDSEDDEYTETDVERDDLLLTPFMCYECNKEYSEAEIRGDENGIKSSN